MFCIELDHLLIFGDPQKLSETLYAPSVGGPVKGGTEINLSHISEVSESAAHSREFPIDDSNNFGLSWVEYDVVKCEVTMTDANVVLLILWGNILW